MKHKSKWIFWGFLSLDYKAIEKYLEEMAAKGWMLEKINRVFAKFIAVEPRKLKFCVDVFKKGGPLAPENTEEAKVYRELCKESGWHFITSLDYLQYFYADKNDDITPIQTDDVLEQKIVASTLWKSELMGLMLFMFIAGLTTVLHFPINYKNLLSYVGVFGTYLFPVLFLVIFISSSYNLSWIFRMRRSVKNGHSLRVPTIKAARRRALAINIPTLVITMIFVIVILLDAIVTPQAVMEAMFAPLLGVCVGLGVRYMIKKKGKEKKDSVLYITLAFLIIVAVIAFTNNSNINFSEEEYNKIVIIPSDYPKMDLGQSEEVGQLIRSGFNPGRSPVVPKHYNYWENRLIDGEVVGFAVNFYQSNSANFARTIFKGINKELEKGIKWKGSYYLVKVMRSDETLRKYWDVDNLSISEERDEIVIQKGETVVHFHGKVDFENSKIRDSIMEGLFNDE
ncbi:MAG: DUF2812 domain-containing protein [Bacillota bacterium]|nr:DUF2812 domain-containing protein [Bacillota bacterium]